MRGLAIAAGVLALSGCAATGGLHQPVVSPTGVVYEMGTPPQETRLSQTALLYFRQERFGRALELALEGVKSYPENPIHFFLAGAAYARLENLDRADSMFIEAQRIYPAYEIEIEPEREAAWGASFNAGLVSYESGDVERTIDVWAMATRMYDLRPEAHRNLAGLLAVEGRYGDAIDVYRRALAGLEKRTVLRVLGADELRVRAEAALELEHRLAELLVLTDRHAEAEPLLRRWLDQDPTSVQVRSDLGRTLEGLGRHAEAREIYSALLSEDELEATQLLNLGVAFFRASDFDGAAEAFDRLIALQPRSRDAWFNYVNALFAAEEWDVLAIAGERLISLEPLGENALLITARAHLETGERDAALAIMERVDGAPFYLDGLQFRRAGGGTSVEGTVRGNAAQAGTPLRVRFTFYGDAGAPLGSETLTLVAPARGETDRFAVGFATRASAYSYDLPH